MRLLSLSEASIIIMEVLSAPSNTRTQPKLDTEPQIKAWLRVIPTRQKQLPGTRSASAVDVTSARTLGQRPNPQPPHSTTATGWQVRCLGADMHFQNLATLDGSFSAASTPLIARLGAFFRIFQNLQDLHSFAPLQTRNFSKNCQLLQNFSEFPEFCKISLR